MPRNGYYGYATGITTAALLQPFDNIKMALIVPPEKLQTKLTSNFLKNIYLAAQYIVVEQGWKSFYKGLVINVWKTGISSAFYFSSLRTFQSWLKNESIYSNFAVSALARITSAIVANPMSVIEARYEIAGKQKWQGSILESMRRIYRVEGWQGFYKGCLASCFKEGCFAGLYYSLYEKGKQMSLSSAVAGMGAGMISTFITHPFEIIRTNIQVDINFAKSGSEVSKATPIYSQLMKLASEGELFKGVAPRLIKKPLANTLAFQIFQYMENFQQKGGSQ